MHPNFMHFRQKISFKTALEIFTTVSGHLKTTLNNKINLLSVFLSMEVWTTCVPCIFNLLKIQSQVSGIFLYKNILNKWYPSVPS